MFDFNVRPIDQKWFAATTPVNYISGLTTTIGSGDNGTITIVDNTADALSIEVVVAGTANASLAAAFASGVITVTLGTDAESAADATKNTATLIAVAINGITDATWTATASGTGATAIAAAVTEKAFDSYETDGTPCPEAGICLYNSATGTYYVCIGANNTTKNNNWRSFTLTNY
ncbi:MAG: hypothetical protein WCS17_12125 [Prevotella sp.]